MISDVFRGLLPVFLCVSNSLESIIIHDYSSSNHSNFSTSYLLLTAEITRIFIIFLLFLSWSFFYKISAKDSLSIVKDSILHKSTIHYLIISFIYTVSNNFGYRAIAFLEPVEYNILSTLKIPMTIFISNVFIKTKDHYAIVRYLSAFAVICGNMLIFLPNMVSGISSVIGVILAIAYITMSSLGAVYSEHIMTQYEEHILIQSVKFSFFSLMINLIVSLLFDNSLGESHDNSFLNISPYTILVVFSICLTGFLTSIVIKFNGGVAKSLSTSGSTAVTMILKNYMQKTPAFYCGVVMSFIGVTVYSFPDFFSKKRTSYDTIADDNYFSTLENEELSSSLFEEEQYYYDENILQNNMFPKRYLTYL